MPERIADRVRATLAALPEGVLLVAAAKTRTPEQAREALEAGVTALGHNYVQEAEAMREALRDWEAANSPPRWHFIGHLQRNKARRAVELFDMIETVDSLRLARALDRLCGEAGKTLEVLIEVNSGCEPDKTGVFPEAVEELVREISGLANLRVEGLMTMGPAAGDPEAARPFFRETKRLFDKLGKLELPHVTMRYLSMGMSNSYLVAIEEGADIVRLGTHLFGFRQ